MSGQRERREDVEINRHFVSESALPQLSWAGTAIYPPKQLDIATSASCLSGDGYGGGGESSLDCKRLESLSVIQQAQLEHGSATHLRQRMESALLHRQEAGFKQASRDSTGMLRSLHMDQQRSAQSYNRPTGGARVSSQQQIVQEALAASVSMAQSDGDEHVVEILKRMQGQMVRMKT